MDDWDLERCSVLNGSPLPPEGGGYLVLTKYQMAHEPLVAAIRKAYPQTKLLVAQQIPVSGSPYKRAY